MTDIDISSVSDDDKSYENVAEKTFCEKDGDYDCYEENEDYYEEDDEMENLSEFEKLKGIYTSIFGEADGIKLAEHMAKISEMNNGGISEENRTEYAEIFGKYQELLNSLGGMQKIIEYSQRFYDSDDDENDEDDEYDEYDSEEDDDEYDEEDEEYSTDGIDVINDTLDELYGDQNGYCYGTRVPYRLGGNDPLDMIQVFESNSGGIPHWHYITCGFTELYEKETDDEETSGYGFELTFRLKKNEDNPPVWPISLLQNIARYVFKTGNTFQSGHHMNANGPVQLGYDTDITALAFIEDPELPYIESENGGFEFIQMVGITNDEMEAVMCWNCKKLMKVFDEFMPLGITDIDRKSFMHNPKVKTAFEKGVEIDGSSTSYIFADRISLTVTKSGETETFGCKLNKNELGIVKSDGYAIYIGAGHIKNIMTMIKGRLLKNRSFAIENKDTEFLFEYDEECGISVDDNNVEIRLNEKAINEMSQKLQPTAGVYEFDSTDIKVVLLVTQIKDANGNIVKHIG